MITLSFGFKKPENGDTGSIVFPALEDNIQQLNDHNHDGVNSSLLTTASFTPVTATALLANWVLVANGIYSQTITLPGAFAYDTTTITVKHGTTGDLIRPRIDKVSNSQFEIFTNDNSIDFALSYL